MHLKLTQGRVSKETLSVKLNQGRISFTVLGKLGLALLLLLAANFVRAQNYEYEVAVEGMACAFCAYTVSKRFQSVPGVVKHSVVVDLKGNRVNFQSSAPLAEPLIKQTLADSGFSVVGIVRKSGAPRQVSAPAGRQIASVSFPVTVLDSQMGAQLLDTLGESAVPEQGRFTIEAPDTVEAAVLKPLIGGRQQAIAVDYVARDSGTVSVTLRQN